MFAPLADKVVDRTPAVYGKQMPARVKEGKTAVLSALLPQLEHVRGVEFLENFNVSPAETAIAHQNRYTGVVVSLTPDYRLSSTDQVWLNGPYSETLSVFPMAEGKFKALDEGMMHSDDSQAVSGIYEKSVQDVFTGENDTQRFCIVNASAGDLSRDIVREWTETGLTVRDAYEKAATEELAGVPDQVEGAETTPVDFDNMKSYIAHVTNGMAGEMGACGEGAYCQVTNTFVRAAQGIVHYLNGAAVPVSTQGTLCHVSPLHGFIRLPRVKERTFYPATLMSSNEYVTVSELDDRQRQSVFTRAQWPGNKTTTVNPYALRRPIQNWQKALPHPTEVFRMHKANFSLDPREKQALSPQAVLAMTPSSEHKVAGITYPKHAVEDRVQLHPHNNLITQLVTMRHVFDILNPDYFVKELDKETGDVVSVHLSIPRDIAALLR